MRTRRLPLAVSAWLVAATGALSADLPPAPQPIDHVRVCDAHGAGYLVIPGTDTCLQISSRVRTDYNVFFNFGGDFDFEPSRGFDSDQNAYRFRARGYVFMDARRETPFGDLRAQTQMRFTRDNANKLVIDLHEAYVKVAGLTLGRGTSFYDFRGLQFTPTEFFDPQFSRNHPQTMLAYEVPFAERYSAALSVEDNTGRRGAIATQALATQYAGAQIPDVILRLQAGSREGPAYAQLMAATHYVNTVTQGIGSSGEQLGFAVGAGAAADLPIGNRTRIGLTSSFARGALSFATTSASAPYDLAGDGVFDSATGKVDLTDAVTVALGGRTFVAPDWELSFQAGVLLGDLGSANTDFDRDGAIDDLDYTNLDLQTFLKWDVTQGLFIGAGAEYRFVDTADFGSSSFLTTYIRAQSTF